MLSADPLANVLMIDLSRRRYRVERREDLFHPYLGGAGAAIRLLAEECPPGADPLSPENPIIFSVGPMNALFPLASKTVAMFKSPHTKNLGESHAGGRSAVAIRSAGYGAIVIKGASKTPVYLSIQERDVHFRDASALWGMTNCYTVGRIIREREKGAGLRTIMRIGQAGEQQIPYAAVTTETYRHFGRLGLGAVFGSKQLKAVVVAGSQDIPTAKPAAYSKLYQEIFSLTQTQVMRKYHDVGTAENIGPLNAMHGLPARNLLTNFLPDADCISGETLAREYLGRRLACAHCPVGCIHIAALRQPYMDESYFYKTSMISYDYEPIYALAILLGGTDPRGFLRLMDKVEAAGIDAISTGVVLAWATEAFERGLISAKETDGLRLAWGDFPTYTQALEGILKGKNEFYRSLRLGVGEAARRYGGQEFALALAGHEMAGYHTGPAAHIGFLIGARHSHLDNAGYALDQKMTPEQVPSPEEMVQSLLAEETWRQVLSSLVVCFFARGIYTPELVSRALEMSGYQLSPDDLQRMGREIWRAKYDFKLREGFSLDNLPIPRRILETPTALGNLSEETFHRAVAAIKGELGRR